MIGLLEACRLSSVKGTRVFCLWMAGHDDRLCSSSLPAISAAREGEETQEGSAAIVQIQIIFFAPLARKKMSIDNESDQVS